MPKLLEKIIKKNNNRNLTRKMVFSYLTVVVVPLVILIFGIQIIVTSILTKNLISQSKNYLSENESKIRRNLKNVELVEQMIDANGNLKMMFISPEDEKHDVMIANLIEQTETISRVSTIVQGLTSVRIFTVNENVPERFPVIFHASRLPEKMDEGWKYNYKMDYVDNVIARDDNLAVYTSKIKYGKRIIGYLQIEIKMQDMFPFLYSNEYAVKFKNGKRSEKDFVYFVSKDESGKEVLNPLVNFEIYDMDLIPPLKLTKRLNKIYNSKRFEKNNSNSYSLNFFGNVYSIKEIPELNMVLVNSCSKLQLFFSHLILIVISFIGIVVLVILLLIVVQYTTRNLLKGVYSIIDGMTNVRNGNLDVKIPEIGNDEITETQKTFNAMTVQIKNQMNQIKTEQELITETEMKAMLNQINAHFLYNVLETIRMQALINNDEETSESILVLGKMMRYCLRWRIVKVPLSQELEYINSYIYILNIRNDYEIKLDINVPDEYLEMEIPKMILQPFIENAFFYAIEPIAEDSELKVFAEKDERKNIVWLCVQDFGIGMSYQKIAEIQNYLADETPEKDSTKGSIGLKNIQMRLTSLYGKDYRLQIISKEGGGTLIRIPVPLGGRV